MPIPLLCRPGSHDHDVVQFRHVNCHESFGGPRTLKGPVPVKCTLGIPDKVSSNAPTHLKVSSPILINLLIIVSFVSLISTD